MIFLGAATVRGAATFLVVYGIATLGFKISKALSPKPVWSERDKAIIAAVRKELEEEGYR